MEQVFPSYYNMYKTLKNNLKYYHFQNTNYNSTTWHKTIKTVTSIKHAKEKECFGRDTILTTFLDISF